MKKNFIIFAAIALAICSCNRNNNNNGQSQTLEARAEEEVLFGIGDLNHDGFWDSVVITMKEVYRNDVEEVAPVQGDGLKIFFGDKKGRYSLYRSYAINNHPDDSYAEWEGIIIDGEENLTIVDVSRTDDEQVYTYVLRYQDNDFYLTDFTMEYGTDEYNMEHYDFVNKSLETYTEWTEMDSDNSHFRIDTYELKDLPLKSLSEFKIGDKVCDFDEYVAHIDEDIFATSGTTKEELCPAEFNPSYEEGDLNRDGIDDLIVNVKNSRFAVYFKNSEGTYNFEVEGKSCDDWTEISAYEKDGNLMVYAFTESSKNYEFHYDDNGYFHLISFDQSMYWPDGGGSYYQFIDFVNGKRTEQEDDDPETTVDIPKTPLRVIEEFHFGNIDEIEDLCE